MTLPERDCSPFLTTICMSDILCVTNRSLCNDDFLMRIEQIAKAKPHGIILREKELCESEYIDLARRVKNICEEYDVMCILHSFKKAAYELNIRAIHMPLPHLQSMSTEEKAFFTHIGASCHSLEEAREAQSLGCTYITVGHIFATDCKKGLPPRGIDFLQKICNGVSISVFAIGGIDAENIQSIRNAGAAGACVMSGIMRCQDTEKYIRRLGG